MDNVTMINACENSREQPRWKKALAQAVRDPTELARLLDLDVADLPGTLAAAKGFKLLVPRGFISQMRPRDPADPLLLQVLPSAAELAPQPAEFQADALGEANAVRAPGLLVKYRGRALLVTSGACAVHCRYCFRRHYPYDEDNPRRNDWEQALRAIAADDSIREVILSGGDPLMLDDAVLESLATRLAAISHVQRLRIHTRLPVVLPERVDARLLAWLASCALRITMVLHINHAHELGSELQQACARLRPTVGFVLNQSVLLAGVNDNVDTLEELSEALDEAGILPYYLHLPDKVSGTAHFDVSEQDAIQLVTLLRARLPGYLVPRLTREIPGASSKLILA